MAAVVVSSLAAVLAGFGLPVFQTAGLGDRGRVNDQQQGAIQRRRQSDTANDDRDFDDSANRAAANVAAAKGAIDVTSVPEMIYNPVVAGSHQGSPLFKPVSIQRQVKFDLGSNTFHEVTPYAEVYGQHPRGFNFARGPPILVEASLLDPFAIVPVSKKKEGDVDSELGEDEEDDDDESEQMLSKAGNLLMFARRPLPGTLRLAIGVLLFLSLSLGPELCRDLMSHDELPKVSLAM